jgi:hypothetical protein
MSSAPLGDAAIVSVNIAVAPAIAFEVFTTELNRWWRLALAFRGYIAGEPTPDALIKASKCNGTQRARRKDDRQAEPQG